MIQRIISYVLWLRMVRSTRDTFPWSLYYFSFRRWRTTKLYSLP